MQGGGGWYRYDENIADVRTPTGSRIGTKFKRSNRIVHTICNAYGVRVRVRVFNATFNNISVISWRPVLLVVEI